MEHRTIDLIDFWKDVPGAATVHPLDKSVFERIEHGFHKECLLTPYMGPLKTAPIVFLFLSAGLDNDDVGHGKSSQGQAYYQNQRTGLADLPSEAEHAGAHNWIKGILKQFELNGGPDWEVARSRVAFLNISPYKSKKLTNHAVLAALPSCRAAIDWAQFSLFPQAERNERLVICLRSEAWWGLKQTVTNGSGLFVPKYTRRGHTLLDERADLVAKVRSKLGLLANRHSLSSS